MLEYSDRLSNLIAAATKAVNVWREQQSFKAYDAAMGSLEEAILEANKQLPLRRPIIGGGKAA